jgi:hypothetical protein
VTGAHAGSEAEHGGVGKALLAQNADALRGCARALCRAGPSDFANRAESFELAQWALQNDAADALSAMADRDSEERERRSGRFPNCIASRK